MRGLLVLAMLGVPAGAQMHGPLTQAGVVAVRKLPDVAPGVAAMPRVVAGTGVTAAVAAVINGHLAALDTAVLKSRRECLQGTTADQDVLYTREVHVLLRGPRFLSLASSVDSNCGGPHLETEELDLTYDLETGRPVNWLAYLPAEATADTQKGGPRSTRVSYVVWPALNRLARLKTDQAPAHDCKAQFAPDAPMDYNTTLGHDGKIVFSPVLEQAENANFCGLAIELDGAAARKMGIAAGLVEVLAAAAKTVQ